MHKNSLKIFFVTLLALNLIACSQSADKSDLQAFMDEVDRRPQGKIPPPPAFEPQPPAEYSAFTKKSPFEPPKNVEEVVRQIQLSTIRPDEERIKEFLEQFRIESIGMVGTFQMQDERIYALVRDGNGEVHEVHTGNYLGKNHGRITSIGSNKLVMLEIVPNGQGGWIERPRTLELKVAN
jgi:type IV pilus assembly protein PilP